MPGPGARFEEKFTLCVLGFLADIEGCHWAMVSHYAGPDLARLAFLVRQDTASALGAGCLSGAFMRCSLAIMRLRVGVFPRFSPDRSAGRMGVLRPDSRVSDISRKSA